MSKASQQASRVRWGDVDESDELPSSAQPSTLPKSKAKQEVNEPIGVVSETVDKSTGIKTVVEYSTNIDGHRIKITRKIKTTVKPQLVNKNVLQRRKWRKFGEAKNAAPGPELNVTIPSNESIMLDLKPKKREEQQVEESALDKIKGGTSIVVCSYCKEPGHFSLKCPKRTQLAPRNLPTDPDAVASSASASAGGPGGSKYVPIHQRAGAVSADDNLRALRDQEPTLRVTNLSEDVTEADLHELFRRFGHTTRIYLAKDRITNVSRGFAFVNFASRTDAQLAIDKLNGHGYDNLILHVEWAKAKEQK